MNKSQVAKRIERLAKIKRQIQALNDAAASDIAVLKREGGGESARWVAKLVTMPRHVAVIPKHQQLRLFAKPEAVWTS